jgi:hypothetical protein
VSEENGEDEPDDDPADKHDQDDLEQCHPNLLDCDGRSVAAWPDVAIGGDYLPCGESGPRRCGQPLPAVALRGRASSCKGGAAPLSAIRRSVDEQRDQISERADPGSLDHNDDPDEPPLVSASARRRKSRSITYLPVDGGV